MGGSGGTSEMEFNGKKPPHLRTGRGVFASACLISHEDGWMCWDIRNEIFGKNLSKNDGSSSSSVRINSHEDGWICPEADGLTNLEEPTLNHVKSDTMVSAVLAVPTRALQGTNWGSRPAMEESENDVGSLEQLLLYAGKHYLAGKLLLRDNLGKAIAPRTLHQLCGQCDVEQCGGNCTAHQGPPHQYTVTICPQNKPGFIIKHNLFAHSVTFHIDLSWHRSRRRCRCSGVKGSARKGRLDLRFASARCLEIVCGTIATPTSARIVERVPVWSTSACRTIHQSSVLVVFLVTPDPVFHAWVPSRVHCSQQFLTAHSE
ncbi:uncharacterized protein TNCV_121321 [Trichonephila clavipes]|nr:uncharacterized protein TNCV_121321 [Trichonephila clavipes]